MWIARNSDNNLWLYANKPVKNARNGYWTADGHVMRLYTQDFPKVRWEDDEPTEVEITIKPKKPCG